MRLIVKNNPNEIGEAVADEILSLVKNRPHAVLGLATGSSPLPVYASLIEKAHKEAIDFSSVKTFNLDEYLNCPDESQTYHHFMREHLFSLLPLPEKNSHFPSVASLNSYDEEIAQAGGIDLQLLGIGVDGHIGFNEPGTAFDSPTHIVTLTESTRQANSRFFDSLASVPTQAISMGLKTIMGAKRIILIADDLSKTKAIAFLLTKRLSPMWPASVLNEHSRVEVYLTKDLATAVKVSEPL